MAKQKTDSAEDKKMVKALKEELEHTKNQLQTTTEKLETSQKELQSVTEELKTVNSELEDKVEKLNRVNNDLKNVLAAAPPGMLILNKNLEVALFNNSAANIFNLIDSDVGRSFSDLAHHLDYQGVLADAENVLNTLQKETEVVTADNGKIYFKEITPYLTTESKLDGVILSFVDITQIKEDEKQLQGEARQVEALAQLGLHSVGGRPLEEVIHHGLQLICEILTIDYGLLLKLNRDHNELQIVEGMGKAERTASDIKIHIDKKWNPASAVDKMKATIIEDFRKNKDFAPVPVFDDKEMLSGANVVVEGSKEPYGILGIYSEQKQKFTDHDQSFLLVIANIFAEMIDRRKSEREITGAYKELQSEYHRGKRLQQEILDTNMADRWNLGSFLHDTLGQKLVAVKMIADSLGQKLEDDSPKVEKIRKVLDESITEIRDLSHNIIPVEVDTGMEHAFEHLMKKSEKLYDIECEMDHDKAFTEIKDRKLATNLYLIVQEAINNATIHGNTKRVKVSAHCGDQLVVKVKDNGSGITKEDRDKSNGSGTRIMQHRVDLLNGSLQIENDPNGEYGGTTVTCKVPL